MEMIDTETGSIEIDLGDGAGPSASADETPSEPWDASKFIAAFEAGEFGESTAGEDSDKDDEADEDLTEVGEDEDLAADVDDPDSSDVLKAQVEEYKRLQNLLAHPEEFLKEYIKALPEADREKVAAVTKSTFEPETSEYGYDPEERPGSYIEEWMSKRKNVIEDMPRFTQEATEAIVHHHEVLQQTATHLHEARLENAVLAAKVDALAQLVNAKLPDADVKKIEAKLKAGADYKTASEDYRKATQRAVRLHRQATKQRDTTPANGGDFEPEIPQNASMMTILRLMGAA